LGTKAYAIDTWKGDNQSGFYSENVYAAVLAYQKQEYSSFSALIRSSFDQALAQFKDNSIDLLHIDGSHSYQAVQHDFLSWKPKLSDKSVVLFHDTQILRKDFGVWKLWSELKTNYPSFEFLHGCGLGVLATGKNVSAQVLEFIHNANLNNDIRDHFKSEGARIYKMLKARQSFFEKTYYGSREIMQAIKDKLKKVD